MKKLKSQVFTGAKSRRLNVALKGSIVAKSDGFQLQRVTPTSGRVIKQTSVKRRKAMKALANR